MTTTTFGFLASLAIARPRRAALGAPEHDELVTEQAREVPRDHRVDRVRGRDPALVPALRQHLIERRRSRSEPLDDEPGVGHEGAERARGEEPQVRPVENAAVDVIEAAEEEQQSDI